MWSRAVWDFPSLVIGIINFPAWLVNGLISVSWSGWINTAMENLAWWLVARSTTTLWGVARYLPADQNCNKSPMFTTMESSMGETRVHWFASSSVELSVSTSRPPRLSWKDNKRQMRKVGGSEHSNTDIVWLMRLYEGPRVRKIYFQLRSLSSKRVGRLHFNKVQSMYLKIIQKVSFFRCKITSAIFETMQIFWNYANCLKITQNVSFEFLNFGIFHQFLSN